MLLLVVSFAVFALAFAGLALGVLFGRPPLRGSCGGLNSSGGACSLCGRAGECKRRKPRRTDS